MADGITRIAVEGFKSIAKRQEIEIAPLTILAGANSSGKSSIMQPLLMLKQTLEATYDPGPLKIDGENVTFTEAKEFLSRPNEEILDIEIGIGDKAALGLIFERIAPASGLDIVEQRWTDDGQSGTLRSDRPGVASERFFLRADTGEDLSERGRALLKGKEPPISLLRQLIQQVIHVPGLRGIRERLYPVANTGPMFPGTFDHYHASLILLWQKDRGTAGHQLNLDLQAVGVAKSVFAHRVGDVAIDLRVGTVEHREDSIADVGFGVSQVLPVLVALRAAEPGRLVYLEEPEIHLHPRAQTKLADILAAAAKRGVLVVAETHSTLLLTAIQTLVAKGELGPDLVKLHWFQRDPKTGVTQVTSADLDENGAFGDWPEDFDAVALDAEGAYLDAVEGRKVP